MIALVSLASVAAADEASSPAFVFVNPARNSFWHTATNSTLSVPVDFPPGVSVATLSVTGARYSAVYEGISTTEFTLTLPAAMSPATENVYDLVLSFPDGTVRKARLGLVESFAVGPSASSRCILPKDGRRWESVVDRAVLPVPYGTSSLTVDGQSVDTGLGGDQGWFMLGGIAPGQNVSLALSAHGEVFEAAIRGVFSGMNVIIR